MNRYSTYKTIVYTLLCLTPTFVMANDVELLPIPVTVEPVSTRSIVQKIEEVGKITALDNANLTFSAGAKIEKIAFNDGDAVNKGDVIAELDSTKAKADLDKARSTLNLAKTKLQRTRDLLAKQPDALSPQDVDELQEQVNLAAADFRQQEATLKDYTIVAPFDGRLTIFSHSIGSHIDASTALVSLYKLDPVNVTYAISQEDLGTAQIGQTVAVSVSAFPNQSFTGEVNYIAPAVDENSGRVEVHATIDNQEQILAPGMFANVSQQLQRGKPQLVVPQNAILANNEQRYLWVVEGNKPQRRQVELGANTNDGYVIIKSGLKKGEQIVTTGQQKLNDGNTVNILSSQPSGQPISKETRSIETGSEQTNNKEAG
ncbi:efflux RND transporter periplasmic adaptor subunit [Photobacterium sp. DNB23_23_1]|uniref:Efflux RND transporter periplasmic adaptor subunit n=1 Tax=Photobacterium pectinilyticum TaxID=2906793 RepID=A0ABT1N513_9GAMM|nr:efflux RND transporter periplasmic adaptor subunit [Photobacterium sp. ZSDE20]MCQ1059826.1 efflux RND transporter periplasmic adaptor subunit [Photobacterium sp. ZSDE20]MDD1826326.1 efflux RND transporter periplasmic adaptor subunit [Photobacterium sp. ZSDE20]